MNVYRAKDGVERFRCFACQEGGDVVDFVAAIERCSKSEAVEKITGEEMPDVGTFKPRPLPPDESAAWIPIIPVPADAKPYKPEFTFNPRANKTKNYKTLLERLDPYHDEEGRLLFFVVRLRFPDGEKACPQITYCVGPGGVKKWCAKRMKPPYPLLGLRDLAEFPKRHVIVVSGEKCKFEHDVHCPKKADGGPAILAVSWLGGDDCVNKTDWSPLVGRKNTYYSDNDDSGRRAMKRIYDIVEIEKAGTG
jgi:putative DNA primase/helicase